MGKYFEWKEEYLIGDPEVDEQHKYLFMLANRVEDTEPGKCFPIIIDLFEYTKVHFISEESAMKDLNYPDYDEHTRLHFELIEELEDLTGDYDGTSEYRQKLIMFFREWILKHILTEDLDFARFIAS